MKKKKSTFNSTKFKTFSVFLAIILITSFLVSASDINNQGSENGFNETVLGNSQLAKNETVLGNSQQTGNEHIAYGKSGTDEEAIDESMMPLSMSLASPASYQEPIYGFDKGPYYPASHVYNGGKFRIRNIYAHTSYGLIPAGDADDGNRPVPVTTDKEMLWIRQADSFYTEYIGTTKLNGSLGAYFWYHADSNDATYVLDEKTGEKQPLAYTGAGRNHIGYSWSPNSPMLPSFQTSLGQLIADATTKVEGGAKAGLYTALVYRTDKWDGLLTITNKADYFYALIWWDPAGISTIEATVDLDGGFVRGSDNTYYNPTTVKPSYNLTTEGGEAPEVTQLLQLVKENAQGNEEVIYDFGTSTDKNWTITSLEKYFDGTINNFPPGSYTFINTASYKDTWNKLESHEARTDFTWIDDSPNIQIANAFNPTETDVTFDTVFVDSPIEWRIYNDVDPTPLKSGSTRSIPTSDFAALTSDTKNPTDYRIELTETYAQGYERDADSKTFAVRRPNPELTVSSDLNPTSIDFQLDSEISNSSYRWKISGPEEISGENKAITTDELTELKDGKYTIELWQTNTDYKDGYEKGTGSISKTFSVITKTIINAPTNIDFGSHKISTNMIVPWESIDNKTASGSLNGEVLAATIKIGSENITGIKLTASPMTSDINDPNASVPGTLYWATFDKQQNVLKKTSLEYEDYYVVDQNSNIAPGDDIEIKVKDNSQVTEGFYFLADSDQVPQLEYDNYSAILTWHVEIVP